MVVVAAAAAAAVAFEVEVVVVVVAEGLDRKRDSAKRVLKKRDESMNPKKYRGARQDSLLYNFEEGKKVEEKEEGEGGGGEMK